MHSNNNELVKSGHDLAADLDASCGAVNLRDVAKLISILATQLDVTTAALRAMTKKRDAEHSDVIAWEKTMFKVCGEDGIASVADKFRAMQSERDHLAAQLADVVAENAALKSASSCLVSEYMMNKGTDSEFIACITPSKKTIGTGGVWDMWRLLELSLKETPATDRFLAEQRAQGVEMLAEHLSGMRISTSETSVREFAAALRNEVKV